MKFIIDDASGNPKNLTRERQPHQVYKFSGAREKCKKKAKVAKQLLTGAFCEMNGSDVRVYNNIVVR
jgi:hypothetical protein